MFLLVHIVNPQIVIGIADFPSVKDTEMLQYPTAMFDWF